MIPSARKPTAYKGSPAVQWETDYPIVGLWSRRVSLGSFHTGVWFLKLASRLSWSLRPNRPCSPMMEAYVAVWWILLPRPGAMKPQRSPVFPSWLNQHPAGLKSHIRSCCPSGRLGMTDNGSEEEEGNVWEGADGGKERDRMKGASEGWATVFCELHLK